MMLTRGEEVEVRSSVVVRREGDEDLEESKRARRRRQGVFESRCRRR